MNLLCKLLIFIWPLLVSALAFFFHRKQNSQKAWTGGPISWPKSFWLAYTTTTWFLFPFAFLLHPDFAPALVPFFVVHLLSWWIRGPLELVMIYKWLNWSPRYGISHDVFHICACSTALFWSGLSFQAQTPFNKLGFIFATMVIFSTAAEILFAGLFLKFRSQQEESENIYFASDDPKWIFINRVTRIVVILVMAHLIFQSFFIWRDF